MAILKVGDKAPLFTLENQRGEKVRLAGFKGQPVVVYFYPKAATPGCTTQSCALRDAHTDFSEAAALVLGISPDAPARLLKFDEKFSLGFDLLADEDHSVAEAWGVWGEKSMYGKKYMGIIRSAFVIDAKGKVAAAFYKVSPMNTVGSVLKTLRSAT